MNADRRRSSDVRPMVGGHVARKRFGQHFLADRSILDALIRAIDPRPGQAVVEIGPGLGALTVPLLERIDHLHVLEIDRDLCARLRRRWSPDRLTLTEGDALRVDLSTLFDERPGVQGTRVVGNLPYNISTPLLVRLIEVRDRILDQHFLLQKEVVDRVVASPGTSAYGRLTVLLQAFYQVESVLDVPPEAFDPPPRVQSALLRMRVLDQARVASREALEQVLSSAFAQRRKMLRSTLFPWLEAHGIDPGDIDGRLRPEDLDVRTYCAWADALRSINSIL
jgi:16S rRNA (adenine1518-N6/adenine1519-N6)-dimethyltransferase